MRKKRKGSAFIYVMVVFIFMTLSASLVFRLFQWNLSDTMHQEERMQLYYMTRSATDLTIGALTQMDIDGKTLLEKFETSDAPTDNGLNSKQTVEFKEGGQKIGETKIEVRGETHEKKRWAKITVVTTMNDKRPGARDKVLTYSMETLVLVGNPLITKSSIK